MTNRSNAIRSAALVFVFGAVAIGCTEKSASPTKPTSTTPAKETPHATVAPPSPATPISSAANGTAAGKRQHEPITIGK